MDQKRIDTANEPVEPQDDEFMDTGVLHEPKTKHHPRCNDQCDGDTHYLEPTK